MCWRNLSAWIRCGLLGCTKRGGITPTLCAPWWRRTTATIAPFEAMKQFSHLKTPGRRRRAAMTLIEMMIAVAVMSIVILAVLSAHFLGLREDQLMESKAGANDTSRKAIGEMLRDIRASKGYYIGSGTTSTNFVAIGNGSTMQGPALELYTTVVYSNQVINQ